MKNLLLLFSCLLSISIHAQTEIYLPSYNYATGITKNTDGKIYVGLYQSVQTLELDTALNLLGTKDFNLGRTCSMYSMEAMGNEIAFLSDYCYNFDDWTFDEWHTDEQRRANIATEASTFNAQVAYDPGGFYWSSVWGTYTSPTGDMVSIINEIADFDSNHKIKKNGLTTFDDNYSETPIYNAVCNGNDGSVIASRVMNGQQEITKFGSWTTSSPTAPTYNLGSMKQRANGDIVGIYSKTTYSPTTFRVGMMLFDSLGVFIRSEPLTFATSCYVSDFYENEDGSFILGGTYQDDMAVMEFDSELNFMSIRTYGDPGLNENSYAICPGGDGTFLLAGSRAGKTYIVQDKEYAYDLFIDDLFFANESCGMDMSVAEPKLVLSPNRPIGSYTLNFQVNGGAPEVYPIVDTIFDTDTFSFPFSYDLSTPGWDVKVWISSVEGSAYKSDTLTRTDGNLYVRNNNDDGPGSLRELLRRACDGDSIRFTANTNNIDILAETPLLLDKDINILGNGQNSTYLSGINGLSRVIQSSQNSRVQDLQIRNTYSTAYGSAVNTIGGYLLLENIIFDANQSTAHGGSVYSATGTTKLLNCVFNQNQSGGNGGSIYTRSDLIVDNCSFNNNESGGSGGAVYVDQGTSSILNSDFYSNVSLSNGGAIANRTLLNVFNTSFSYNEGINGGVIRNVGTITLDSISFTDNSASGDGGCIHSNGTTTLTKANLQNNQSVGNGATILNGGSFFIEQCSFSDNVSNQNGCIYHDGDSLSILSSTIARNDAGLKAGGIYNNNAALSVNFCTISENTATADGVGLYQAGSSAALYLSNSILSGNTGGENLQVAEGLLALDTFNLIDIIPGLEDFNDHGTGRLSYKLNVFGPAIDAADPNTTVLYDQDGKARNHNNLPDIGAIESHDSQACSNVVINKLDNSLNSLRVLIRMAESCGFDTIYIDPSLNGQQIDIADSSIVITHDLVLIGGSSFSRPYLTALDSSRIFHVLPTVQLTIKGLILQNGYADEGGAVLNEGAFTAENSDFKYNEVTISGGAIASRGADLLLKDCYLYGNIAAVNGGGLLVKTGNVLIDDCRINSNDAGSFGGGVSLETTGDAAIYNTDIISNGGLVNWGAGIRNAGTLYIEDCNISQNNAGASGGGLINFGTCDIVSSSVSSNSSGSNGGAIANWTNSQLSISSSVLNTNTSTSLGGAIYNDAICQLYQCNFEGNSSANGGAIRNNDILTGERLTLHANDASAGGGALSNIDTASFTNCTFSGNDAATKGGAIRSVDYVLLNFCTIVNNTADDGGAVSNGGALIAQNSIIGNNTANINPDISSTRSWSSNGYNIVSDTTGSFASYQVSDLVGTQSAPVDPMVMNIAYIGGFSRIHRLQPGSPAIDAAGFNLLPSTDHIGRQRIQGGIPDIGAYETDPACVEDAFEPNDNLFAATTLISQSDYNLTGTICDGTDQDWFNFSSGFQTNVKVRLMCLPDDYKLDVYNEYGVLIGSSDALGNTSEEVILNGIPAFTALYARVMAADISYVNLSTMDYCLKINRNDVSFWDLEELENQPEVISIQYVDVLGRQIDSPKSCPGVVFARILMQDGQIFTEKIIFH